MKVLSPIPKWHFVIFFLVVVSLIPMISTITTKYGSQRKVYMEKIVQMITNHNTAVLFEPPNPTNKQTNKQKQQQKHLPNQVWPWFTLVSTYTKVHFLQYFQLIFSQQTLLQFYTFLMKQRPTVLLMKIDTRLSIPFSVRCLLPIVF